MSTSVAVVFFPFSLPVPWTGIFLVTGILSVSVLPALYGRIYIRETTLGCLRELSTNSDSFEEDTRDAGDVSEGFATNFRLENDLFGGEVFPLLGSTGVGELGSGIKSCSLTWRQVLRVSVIAGLQENIAPCFDFNIMLVYKAETASLIVSECFVGLRRLVSGFCF